MRPFGFSPVTFGNNDTFATGLMNVDLAIESGNPAAVGVRWGGAQLFLMQDVVIDVGEGYAGIDHNANLLQRVTVRGGEIGMLAFAASPGWQTSILDSRFEGQREAAIKLHTDSKLTVMRTTFKDSPAGLVASPGQPQRLYIQDSVFDGITDGPVILNDNDSIPADEDPQLVRAQNQLNVVNTGVSDSGPLLRLQPSGATWHGPGPSYLVTDGTLGLRVQDALSATESRSDRGHLAAHRAPQVSFASLLESDIPIPPSSDDWVSITDYAAEHGHTVGTGVADDHHVFQQAIDEYDTIFVPMGEYVISDTLRLRPSSSLIGLHPRQTWLRLPDEEPRFADADQPRAMIETPPGGRNIVMGIGLDTAENTPGSAHVRWRSGAQSHLADIITQFVKWHPEETQPGDPAFGDPGYGYRGDHRYSIWVDGGGGTFSNIFTATGWSENGFLVESSHTPSRVYQSSVEHHEFENVVLRDVRNWEFHALQTEAHIYGWRSQAVTMHDVHDVLFGNTVFFRVGTVLGPHHTAMEIENSSDVTVCGTRGYRPLNIENTRWGATMTDTTSGRSVPELDIAYLEVGAVDPTTPPGGHAVTVTPHRVAVLPGATAEVAIEIRNEGPGDLFVDGASLAVPSGWSTDVQPPAESVPAGGSRSVVATIGVPTDVTMPSEHELELELVVRRSDDVTRTLYPIYIDVGGSNLALGATVSASSVLSTNAATNAVDGQTTGGRWISGSGETEPEFTVELASPGDVHLVRVYSGVAGSEALRVAGFVVEGRARDGWVEIGSIAGNTVSPVDVQLEPLGARVDQVRLRFSEPSPTDSLARVFELETYGFYAPEEADPGPVGAVTAKTVSAGTDVIGAGTVLTYTLSFESPDDAPALVDHVDLLAGVLDDAELTAAPVASDGTLSVSELHDGRFTITGELEAGETETVSYEVTVKDAGERGDHRADNYLLPVGEAQPGVCQEDAGNCTVTLIPTIDAIKSAQPSAGSPLSAGDEVRYTLTFANPGSAPAEVDYTDHLTEVLDDAALTSAAVSSDPALSAVPGPDGTLRVTGDLGAGQEVTIDYAVTIGPDGGRGDDSVYNLLAPSEVIDPDCEDAGVSCTQHAVTVSEEPTTEEPTTEEPATEESTTEEPTTEEPATEEPTTEEPTTEEPATEEPTTEELTTEEPTTEEPTTEEPTTLGTDPTDVAGDDTEGPTDGGPAGGGPDDLPSTGASAGVAAAAVLALLAAGAVLVARRREVTAAR